MELDLLNIPEGAYGLDATKTVGSLTPIKQVETIQDMPAEIEPEEVGTTDETIIEEPPKTEPFKAKNVVAFGAVALLVFAGYKYLKK